MHHGGANIHHHRTHEEWQLAGVPAGFVLIIFSSYLAFESTYDIVIVSAFRASYTMDMVLRVIVFSLQGQTNLAELMMYVFPQSVYESAWVVYYLTE